MSVVYQDNILNEMILKNGLSNRIVDLNEGFDENSIYKCIYLLEKIVLLDDKEGKPIEERESITIRINSYGGYCYELWSIIGVVESLKQRGYIINTVCMGKAMSCGFILFCAGVNRKMYKCSTLMYHSVSSGAYGKVSELEDNLKETQRLNDMAKEYVVANTNITMEKLEEMDKFKMDWYMGSDEALSLGVATEIL